MVNWKRYRESTKQRRATDGPFLGTAEKWESCGWSVVQLNCDEEMGPLHGMYGLMEGADGLSMLSQESDWTHEGACRQQKDL